MTNVIRLADYLPTSFKSAELRLSFDSYSVKVSCPDDKLFWVRIEPVKMGSATITDFKISAQSRQTLSAALVDGLAAVQSECVQQLHFSDIVPSGPANPIFAQKLTAALEDIKVACQHYAREHGADVAAIDANSAGDKVHVDVTFQPLQSAVR